MKAVLITGATSGFGKGLVVEFLKNNFKVIATGRKLTSRKDIFLKEREEYKDNLVELDLDVTSTEEIQKIGDYFTNTRLDLLINNAGFAVFGPAETCEEEKIRKQFEVNFFGLVFLTQKLLPHLRLSKGHIINFSSVFGIMGFPLSSFYCASKYAVEGFSESLSYEMKPFGVKVTLIEPGGYRTNFNTNAEWGMNTEAPKSAYYKQIKNYTSFRDKLANRPNPPNPQEVIKGVLQIAKNSSPKLNYTFGKDAFITKIMRKTLSRTMFHKLTGNYINKILSKEI